MKLVSEWFERFYKDYQGDAATAGVRASERTQGKHIYAPLFSGEHVALVAGPRELRFSWLGGTPPYQLKLYKKGETSAIVSAERINDSRYKTKRITLSPGEYELEIGDTNGDSQKELIVAGTATIPQQPQELRDSRMPEDDRSVLFAAWLAAQGNGKWIFEAYQRIAEIPEAYTPAIKLRQALELGIVPASP